MVGSSEEYSVPYLGHSARRGREDGVLVLLTHFYALRPAGRVDGMLTRGHELLMSGAKTDRAARRQIL